MPLRDLLRYGRGPQRPTAASLQKDVEAEFLYRGAATLDIRDLSLSGETVRIAFNARPVFAEDRRIRNNTRAGAFAQQLFQDAVTVLKTIWGAAPAIETIELAAWLKLVDGSGEELVLLTTHATRERMPGLRARDTPLNRLAPIDVLRRFPTRTRVDSQGNFHEERTL